MAADFQKPALPDQYAAVLQEIRDMFAALGIWMDGTLPANVPAGAKRWSSANKRFEQFDGTAWNALVNQYAIDVLSVGGYQAGHATGQVPVSDGAVNTDLNADLLDGQHGAYYATQAGLAAVQTTANAALPQAGGELTGQTSISGAAGTNRQFGWQTVGVARWFGGADASAEPNDGSNSGSNWFLSRFDDSGNYIDTPLSVSRSTGAASFSKRPTFAGNTPWDDGNLLSPASWSGGTYTGLVNLADIDAPLGFPRSAAGTRSYAVFSVNGKNRWAFGRNNAAETGLNAGSDFFIQSSADDGTGLPTPVTIARSTGVMSLAARPVFNGATPWDSGNLPNPQTALGYTPAHADANFSWVSVWTGSATSINIYSNWGVGIYLIQTGGSPSTIQTIITTGSNTTADSSSVALGDIYNAAAPVVQIWKLTKS